MNEETADVVVIGAGIVGASCAYHLAARGKKVIVLEKELAPAMGSTGRSAAGVRVQFTTEDNIRMSQLSIRVYREFEVEHERSVGYAPIGYLLLVPPDRWETHLEAVALQREIGVPVEVVALDRAQRWVDFSPDGLAGTTFGPEDGVVDPHLATHAFVSLARELGANFRLASSALEISRRGAYWRIDTGSTAYTTVHVVNAAGAWSGEVAARAGLTLPVVPVRRQVYVTAPIEDQRTYPLTIDLETGFWLRSEGDRVLFGLSKEDEAPGFVEGVDEEWLEHTLLVGVKRFPWLEDIGIDVRKCWWGYYEITPDHNPIIGRHPNAVNWIDAAGFSGHGIMHAPATGLLVAETIVDGEPRTLSTSTYSHARFTENAEGEANIF